MTYDTHEQYYRDSRGYNWNDMAAMRNQAKRPSTNVPDVFKSRFATPAEYDAWLDQKHKEYFG
jgi:hypothetical protein